MSHIYFRLEQPYYFFKFNTLIIKYTLLDIHANIQ